MKADKARQRARMKAATLRKAELLSAAEVLFLDRGVAPTTIDQITAAAGVGKGSFYLQFKDKNDLVLALRERFDDSLVNRAKTLMARSPAGDWRALLANWTEAAVDAYLSALPMHHTIFHSVPPPGGRHATSKPIVDHLAGFLAAGARQGAWKIEDSHLTAVLLSAGLHGIIDSVLDRGIAVDRAALLAEFRGLCCRSLGIPSKC